MNDAQIRLQEQLRWTLQDRLAKALEVADVSVQDMATTLEVSRNTVGNYLAGRTNPSKATRAQWALLTGVPIKWIETGMLEIEPDAEPDENDPKITERYLAPVTFLADRRKPIAA